MEHSGGALASIAAARRTLGRGRGRITNPVAPGYGVELQQLCQPLGYGTAIRDAAEPSIQTGPSQYPTMSGLQMQKNLSAPIGNPKRVSGRGRATARAASSAVPLVEVTWQQFSEDYKTPGVDPVTTAQDQVLQPVTDASAVLTQWGNAERKRQGYQHHVADTEWAAVDVFTTAVQNPSTLTPEQIESVIPAVWREVVKDASVAEAAASYCVSVIVKERRGIFLHDLLVACYSRFNFLLPATRTSSEPRGECTDTRISCLCFIAELVLEMGKEDTVAELRELASSLAVLFCGYCTDLLDSAVPDNVTYVQRINQVVLRASDSIERFAPFSMTALAALAKTKASERNIPK